MPRLIASKPTFPVRPAESFRATAPVLLALIACALANPARAADARRAVPDGTLTYAITVAGHAEQGRHGSDHYVAVTIDHRLQARWRLHGGASNGNMAAPAQGSAMQQLSRSLEACGDDQACAMKIAMRMSGTQRAALQQEGQQQIDAVGRNTMWTWAVGLPCTLSGRVADDEQRHATVVDDAQEGGGAPVKVRTHITRSGERTLDCASEQVSDVPSLEADPAAHHYTLTLPTFAVQVAVSGDHESTHGEVRFDATTLAKQPLGALDRPQHGSRVFASELTRYGLKIPVKTTLSWQFVPDARR